MTWLLRWYWAWLGVFLVLFVLVVTGIYTPSYYLTTLAVAALLVRAQIEEISDETYRQEQRARRLHPSRWQLMSDWETVKDGIHLQGGDSLEISIDKFSSMAEYRIQRRMLHEPHGEQRKMTLTPKPRLADSSARTVMLSQELIDDAAAIRAGLELDRDKLGWLARRKLRRYS